MALPHATQPTTRTILAGVGWIDIFHQQATSFGSVGHALAHHTALPLAQAAARPLPHPQLLGRLRQRQALEHQHRVGWHPGHQFGSRLLAEGARAVALLAAKPFQQAAHRARVLLLCLVGRKRFLEAAAGLARAEVPHLEIPPTDKEGRTIRSDGNQGVGLVQVDPNRVNALRIGDAKGDNDATEQPPVALDHRQAVNLGSFGKGLPERIRQAVGNALAPCYRPERQRTIVAETGIAPARANQKQCSGTRERERALCRLLVRFGAGVGSGDEPDGRAGHLAADSTLDLLVDRTMQRQRREWRAIVVTHRRDALLDTLKPCKRCPQIRVIGKVYRDCALHVHMFYYTTAIATKQAVAVNIVALTAFPAA